MFIPYKYTYFLGTILFFIPWSILYLKRKDLRKEMLFMSVPVAVGSFVTAYVWWTIDWWHPQTITGTKVGIEDILLGFSNGGIAAVLYEVVFKRALYRRGGDKSHTFGLVTLILVLGFTTSFLFWGLQITSAVASAIGMISTGIALVLLRKDLFISALLNGFLMVVVSLPIYYILIIVSPGWVEKTWIFNKLSGAVFTGIPIEDIVFYYLFGFVIAPFYEYWQNLRLRKIN